MGRFLVAGVCLFTVVDSNVAYSQDGETALATLTPEERTVVSDCLDQIRSRQLRDGSIRMTAVGDEVWLEQYFALEACVALLSSGQCSDVDRVRRYLQWYAQNIEEPFGVAYNYEVRSGRRVKLAFDSIDSYAGLFLLATARVHAISGDTSPAIANGASRSLYALEDVIRNKRVVAANARSPHTFTEAALTNGLPINTGSAVQHLLMDSIEAYAGLRESVELFRSVELPKDAATAHELANGIAQGMRLFEGSDGFAHVVMNGNDPQFFDGRDTKALANLYALAYLPPKYKSLWSSLNRSFQPDNVDAAECPAERWLIAATRVMPSTAKSWRERVVRDAGQFDRSTYLGRLAVTVIALIDGPARYPEVIEQAVE